MEKINLMNKNKRNTQTGFEARVNDFYRKLELAELRGSTGSTADMIELAVRHACKPSGVMYNDIRVHSSGEHDVSTRVERKLLRVEVKTGNGIIGYTRTETIDERYCKLDQYVAYCPTPKTCATLDDVLDTTLVFTRDEFIAFVGTVGLKRKAGNFSSGCKLAVNSKALREENKLRKLRGEKPLHDCIALNPAYQEARIRAMESGEYMTLRSFLQELVGEE